MNFSKFFFITIFNLQPLFFISSTAVAPSNPFIFREYIGYVNPNLYNNVSFSDVPINPNVEFHFILSFANDYTNFSEPSTNKPFSTDGGMSVYWDTKITPSEVLSIKSKHSNVKVALSIGGFTIAGDDASFYADDVDSWVTRAVFTLTDIVKEYHIDGIDIYYRKFDQGHTLGREKFGLSMGKLITILKENGVISFASIAPSHHEHVESQYLELWRNYGHLIDYVNFQFYEYDKKWMGVDQFIDYFDIQSTLYKGGNILAGLISDDSGGLTSDNGFFAACNKLRSSRKNFMGIFVWNADLSKTKGFLYENQSQALLATPQY